MHSLLLFIRKHWFVVLFLLLETASLIMVSNSYSYHRSLSYSTVNDLTGGVFSAYSNISDYFSLKQANDSLVNENAALRDKLQSSFLITDTNFVYKDTLYRYIPAHVVSISVNHSANYIMINKGSLHGVKKEMSVVSTNGVAGIIIGVSNHYSLAMSMLHHNTRISGRIKKEYPRNKIMRISHEAIYQYIYRQFYREGNGTLKKDCKDLRQHLPKRRRIRMKRGRTLGR